MDHFLFAVIKFLQDHPALTSTFGAVSAWAAVFLVVVQILAAILACIVSICSLILIWPKVKEVIVKWGARKWIKILIRRESKNHSGDLPTGREQNVENRINDDMRADIRREVESEIRKEIEDVQRKRDQRKEQEK